jgi:hypothetical protein
MLCVLAAQGASGFFYWSSLSALPGGETLSKGDVEMINVRITVLVMVVFSLATGVAKADLMGYIATSTSNSVVYKINIDTGESTAYGPSGISPIRALEYVNGVLYATSVGTGNGLWTIDTSTGIGSFVGNTGIHIDDLAAAPDGSLFGNISGSSTGDELVTIDPNTGGTTLVGSMFPYISMSAFAISSDGTAVGWDSGAKWLFDIDLSDASTTSIGLLDDSSFLAFDYDTSGTLYGWTSRTVRSIDTVNLTSTSVQSFSFTGSGFTLIPIPEPTTVTLALAALCLVVGRRRA